MEIAPYPKRGEYIYLMCKSCFKTNEMKITAVKKHQQNSDGSYRYTVKAKCSNCNYSNGEHSPIWFNFFRKGAFYI